MKTRHDEQAMKDGPSPEPQYDGGTVQDPPTTVKGAPTLKRRPPLRKARKKKK